MRKLQVVAEGDVSHAKASLRSLSVEKAKALAEEKQHASASAQLARDNARFKIEEAKKSGTVQRDELAKLKQAERDAAQAAKAAAKEAADAKKLAAQRTADAAKIAKAEEARINRLAEQQLVADLQDRARQRRKLAPADLPDRPIRANESARNEINKTRDSVMGGMAIMTIFQPVISALENVARSISDARKAIADQSISIGVVQSDFARKMRNSGFKENEIRAVLKASQEIDGIDVKTAIDAADEALSGGQSVNGIISSMGKRAREPIHTKSQQVAKNLSAADKKRFKEITPDLLSSSAASAGFGESVRERARVANAADDDEPRIDKMLMLGGKGTVDRLRTISVGAWKDMQFIKDKSTPVVRVELSDDQVRALSGPKSVARE